MTRAQLRTHVTHDTNTEHDFPVGGTGLIPPTADQGYVKGSAPTWRYIFTITLRVIRRLGEGGLYGSPPTGKSCSVFVSCVTCVRSCARVIRGSWPLRRIRVLLLLLLFLGFAAVVSRMVSRCPGWCPGVPAGSPNRAVRVGFFVLYHRSESAHAHGVDI